MNLSNILLKAVMVVGLVFMNPSTVSAQTGVLTGNISLPNNTNALEDIDVVLTIYTYDLNGALLGFTNTTAIIQSGNSDTSYSLTYDLAPMGGSYRVQASSCRSNCNNYLSISLYLQDDGSSAMGYNIIDQVLMPTTLDFELIEGSSLTGTISLPNNATADAGAISIVTTITTYDENGSVLDNINNYSTINSSESSTIYSLLYAPAPTGGSYQVYSSCYDNCDGYLNSNLYLQDDGSIALDNNTIDESLMPTSLGFELIGGSVLTGTISLPNNATADAGAIYLTTFIFAYDASDSFVASFTTSSTINNGATSTTYSLPYTSAPTGGSYTVFTSCSQSCGNYLSSALYLQDNGSITTNYNAIDDASMPTSLDFELLEGSALTGTISLSNNGTTHVGSIGLTTRITSFDAGDTMLNSFSSISTINIGDTSTIYSLPYSPAPISGSYSVYTYCSSNCGNYPISYLYLQDDGSIALDANKIDAASMPTSLDFELIEFSLVNVTPVVTLSVESPFYSTSTTSDEAVWMQVDHVGGALSCNTFGSDYNTQLGIYSSDGTLLGENIFSGGSAQSEITFTDLESSTYFLAATGAYSIFSPLFNIAAGIESGNLVVNCLLADAYEEDNDQTTNNIISGIASQTHSIHQAGDHDWLTFSINSSSNISISAQSLDISDGAPLITVYDAAIAEIQISTDILDESEQSDSSFSSVTLSQLIKGAYYIKIEGFSTTSTNSSYTLKFEGPDDSFCIPIKTVAGGLVVICL